MRLTILGLLIDKPMYGYDIKKTIENRMGGWTDFKFGSIYFALKKLESEGLLYYKGCIAEGNRPAKTVYGITEKGKKEFYTLLRQRLRQDKRVYYPFDVGIFFSKYLDNEEVNAYIEGHIEYVQEAIKHLEIKIKTHKSKEEEDFNSSIIMLHTLEHLRAELKWLKQLKAR